MSKPTLNEKQEMAERQRKARIRSDFRHNVQRPAASFSANAAKALGVILALLVFVTVLMSGVDEIKLFEVYSDGSTSFSENDRFVLDFDRGIQRLRSSFSLDKYSLNQSYTAFFWIGAPFRWLGSIVSLVTRFFGG